MAYMFRTTKTTAAPAKSPSHKPGGGKTNDANSLAGCGAPGALPMLGRVNPSHLLVGTKVWVADARVLWRIGEVQSIDVEQQTADVYVPDAPDEKLQTLSLSKLYTFDASHIIDHDDVAAMNNLHEAPLLSVLRQRFERDRIYTFTADILLSINPYKSIPLLYDVLGFMEQQRQDAGDAAKQPPHLFTIAAKAYAGMKGELPGSGTPQSIIISGESGAGKTEASKYIMKYLATASKHASASSASASSSGSGTSASASASAAHVHERIEECVVLSNLILESFGNAKTSRNDNSSRFGKYIQIHYNNDGRMVGVSIRHFLLEKTRLVLPQASERNYHIFYQLLAGLANLGAAHAQTLKLASDVWNYTYLTHGDCVDIDGVDDAVEFEQLRSCLSQLGMDTATFQMPMFAILAAVLHLGNVQFETVKASASSEDETTIAVFPESDRGVDLAHVSALLGVEPLEFAKKMVTQTTVTGRGSILELKLTAEQAKNAMDAFCKHLYGELFHHLIARINACAKEHTDAALDKPRASSSSKAKGGGTTSAPAFIGILDIFGFEVMATNSLEQLCINFTNETLQQQFNRHVFVLEQERYASEGIAFSSIEFQDNQPCLELIQKPPTGLLPLLEEQMLLKRKTTDKQLLTIYHGQHLDKHPSYTKPRFECDEFMIRHYAGEVVYSIHGFIAKNTDNLHDDLLDLLKRSAQPLVHAIFTAPIGDSKNPAAAAAAQKRGGVAPAFAGAGTGAAATSKSGGKAGGAALTGTSTVSSRFRTQLSELMDVLWQTTPNYIKCIKPNNLKFPGGFSCELVRDQLVYSGVLEVVRIRQEGFPIRKRFDVFYELFWPLAVTAASKSVAGGSGSGGGGVRQDPQRLRDACEQIATAWLEEPTSDAAASGKRVFAMGRQEVFLRYGQVEKLEAYVASLRAEKAVVLQAKLVRCRLAYRQYQLVKRGMRQLQAIWRMHATRAHFCAMKAASVHIQTQVRGARLRWLYCAKRRAASCVFRATMRFLTHRRFVVWQTHSRAAVTVQRHVRGFLSRTAAERARKLRDRSVLVIQSWRRMSVHHRAYVQQRRAIVRIQSEYRSVIHRRAFLRRKHASIVVAAFARQVLQRRKFTLLKRRVVKLQALVRKWKQRSRYVRLRALAVWLQSKRRQRCAQQIARTRRAAVCTMQHALRGWSCRCRYLTTIKSVAALQYWAASWLLQREFRRTKLAARRVQRAWRRHRRIAHWKLEVDSLFRSPFAVTGTSYTQHSKMEESERRIQRLRQSPALFFRLRPKTFGYNSLFHHAAACGDADVVKYMLAQREVAPRELLRMENGRGNTALHEACRHGQYAMVKFLLVQMCSVLEPLAAVEAPCGGSSKASAAATSDPSSNSSSSTAQATGSSNNQGPDITESASDKQPAAAAHPLDKTSECGPESDVLLPPGVVFSGYLRKRRETSRWMKRFVVLRVTDAHVPQLEYFANSKAAALAGARGSMQLDLRVAVLKKSVDTPFAFELHSPQLLAGRNKEGRLYFAAASELESQQWLAQLRDAVPSSLELRLFAMHRSAASGALEYVDFGLRQRVSNLRNGSARRETLLHLAARVALAATTGSTSETLDAGVSGSVPGSAPRASWTAPIAMSGRATVLSPKATALDPAVTASSISVTAVDDESSSSSNQHQHSSSEIRRASGAAAVDDSAAALLVGKSKLEVEADIVRTVLWLVESGAEINAMTAHNETALQLAIRANNLLVAKHLLDRGALVTGLLPTELEVAQRLKAALAKTAISSVGCSRSDHTRSSSSSAAAALASRLGSFRKKATGSSSPAAAMTSIADAEDAPPLFLLKQPGRVRNSSYVSVFLEHIGISNPQYLSRPRVLISVLDAQRHIVERRQLVAVQPVVLPVGLLWSITWHMQTPLENLPHGACVVFELTISPSVSAVAPGVSGSSSSSTAASSSSMATSSSAADFVPVCWTYIQVDQRTANSMALNAEMYKYPLDLSLKKLQRVDAFINGDVLVSQGPSH